MKAITKTNSSSSRISVLTKQLCVLVFLFATTTLSAQMKMGIKAGISNISTDEVYKEVWNPDTRDIYGLTYLSTKTGYSYGLAFYKDISHAWLSTEVLYRTKSVQYEMEMLSTLSRASSIKTDNFREITIPVAAGWRRNNFKLGLGPVFNFKLDGEYSLTDYVGFEVKERKLSTGFQFVFGYVVKDRIHIDIKREVSFNGAGDEYEIAGKSLNLNTLPKNFTLSVGIYL